MSWTEQDLRAVLRDQVAVVPSPPDRATAIHGRIVRRRRRTTAAVVAVLVLVAVALGSAIRLLPGHESLPPVGPHVVKGSIVYADASGDIRVLDPATGASSVLIGGPDRDIAPGLTPDGRHILFIRDAEQMFYTANLDGSGVTRFRSSTELDNWGWSPDGSRIAAVSAAGTLAVIDAATGSRTVLPVAQKPYGVTWTGDDSLLVMGGDSQPGTTWLRTMKADGTGESLLAAPQLCCSTTVLKGTDRVVWTSWDNVTGAHGRLHLRDLSTGKDVLLPSTDVSGAIFMQPQFSPDGRWLTAERLIDGKDGKQLVLLAADGSGRAIPLGPSQPTNQSEIRPVFSPDGSRLLVLFASDASAWMFDVASGTGAKQPWEGVLDASWVG